MTSRARLLGLLLLVRDDCIYVDGYYLLRPSAVETLLEEAIVAVKGLVAQEQAVGAGG